MAELRKYGVATTVVFPLVSYTSTRADFSTSITFATGDFRKIKDEATAIDCDSTGVFISQGIYSLALSSSEMTASRILIVIQDGGASTATSKLFEDQAIIIETYGSTSGQHSIDIDSSDGRMVSQVAGMNAGTITSTVFAAGAINDTAIATAAITSTKFGAGAINDTAIATGAITAAKFAANAHTTGNIDSGVFAKIASDVNVEVLDVLTVDTFAESTVVPAATATLERKWAWMQTLARNEIRANSTTQYLLGDTGNQVATAALSVSTTVVANTTTVVRGEFA